jgi:hypothetical protein
MILFFLLNNFFFFFFSPEGNDDVNERNVVIIFIRCNDDVDYASKRQDERVRERKKENPNYSNRIDKRTKAKKYYS